jgi:hypothetical protein
VLSESDWQSRLLTPTLTLDRRGEEKRYSDGEASTRIIMQNTERKV